MQSNVQNFIPTLQKIFAALLVCSLLLPAPLFAQTTTTTTTTTTGIPLGQVVTIPKIVIDTITVEDMSLIDWNQLVSIGGVSVTLSSPEALQTIDLPKEVKHLVEMYREDYAQAPEQEKIYLTEALQNTIAQYFVQSGVLPKNYFELKSQGLIEPVVALTPVSLQGQGSGAATAQNITVVATTKESAPMLRMGSMSMLSSADSALSGAAGAAQYLLAAQNEDGSWGSGAKQFFTTTAVLNALDAYGERGAAYQRGAQWVANYLTDNNDYLAQRVEVVARAQGATSTAEDAETLAFAMDDTGGFAFARDYQPDALTTARVLQALTASAYADAGDNPTQTTSLALYYLLQSQRFDNGWSVFEGGVYSVAVTSEVVEALLPHKGKVLSGFEATPVEINDTLTPALLALKAGQLPNGTWNNSLLDTAQALRTLKKANMLPTYAPQVAEYLENAQAADGSFGSSVYATAEALGALALPGAQMGALVITDIVPLNTLRTQSAASIRVDMTNNGGSTIHEGILHVVVDGYVAYSYNFASNDFVLDPGQNAQITFNIANTAGFVGDVAFDVFVEGSGEVVYPQARYQETLQFAGDLTQMPGLPVYFVAHKYVIDGKPALNVRWKQKDDATRKQYLILWRTLGYAGAWSGYGIENSKNGAYLSPFVEGQTYEVTVGVMAHDGRYLIYENPVQIKTSASTSTYTAGTLSGVLKDVYGPVANVSLLAGGDFNSTDENGSISLSNVPYGRGWVRTQNFRYEDYVNTFTTADTPVANYNAYTNLRLDTQKPTVTYLAMANESDFVMENAENKYIHLRVADDIGSGEGTVESATFSYYDPSDARWHSIGVMPGPISDTVGYYWDVPNTLLGPGYKLRAVVRDYSGKDSDPVEWGPFEFTQGNLSPEFSFVTASATSTVADLSHTIQWTDKDADDNASILLSFDPDTISGNANHTNIVTVNEDDSTNQYVWDTASVAPGTYYIWALVSDGTNATVIEYAPQAVVVSHSAPRAPTKLLTELKVNPINITDATPEFSALYTSPVAKNRGTHYRLQVAATSTFSELAWDTAKVALASSTLPGRRIPDVSYAGAPLASTTPHYWRIKFWDNLGQEGAWSTTTASFTLAASKEKAPTAPASLRVENLLNPVDITDSTPEFSAVYTDPNIGDVAQKYRIQIATTNTFTVPVWDSGTVFLASSTQRNTRTPQISYSGTGLASTTQHYWRIKFWDTYGNEGAWSTATSTFSLARTNTRPTIPTALLLEGVVNPTKVTDSTPEFSAIFNDPDAVDSARKYNIQVSASKNFVPMWWNSGIATIIGTTSSGSRIADIPYAGQKLASSTIYYWRIRFFDAKNAGGPWSARAQFTLSPSVQ